MHPDFERLQRDFGIVVMGGGIDGYIEPQFAMDYALAMDAQPTLVTTANSGIPAFLSNYMDPKVIQVILSPMKATEILPEVKKGVWTTRTTTFTLVESTGQVSSYGDTNNNGSVNANVEFPQRQSYHYQTITIWGEKQLDEAGLAKIDWASRLNIASAIVLNKFQNNSYFYGITGLQNYGILNDPYLSASITPATKVAGGLTWAVASANEIYADIQALYQEIIVAGKGNIDQESSFILALSPGSAMYLTNTNSFNVSVTDLLKKNFPNLRVVTAPQYATTAGNVAQLICESVDGQESGLTAFTEKMRAHPVIPGLSEFRQKKSQGTWGAIIFLPYTFATMLGM